MKHRRISSIITLLLLAVCGAAAQETTQRSDEAEALLQCFRQIEGQKTLAGTMANVNWNINEAKWVNQHTGKWPALNGFDYLHLPYSASGSWIDYSNVTDIYNWHRQGGVVALMWHWNVPANESGQYSFYWGEESDKTTFDVKKIFEPESEEYKLMIKDIDKVASYLKLLKNRRIPVLWRPLHEAGGMWFWWGRDPEACNELWRVMYKRFQEKGLDNLIWVWTHAVAWNKPYSDGYKWYPGDEYVDIVGIDIYNNSSTSDIYANSYKFLKKQSPDKLVALTECGNIPKMGLQWRAGCKWLFFMPWYDYERTNNVNNSAFKSTDHGHANAAWWQEAFTHDYVLTRDDFKQVLTSVKETRAAETEYLRLQNGTIVAKGQGMLYIYKVNGQLVRQHLLSDSSQRFSLNGLPRGIYIIKNGNKTLRIRHSKKSIAVAKTSINTDIRVP